eukprot:sb/3470080/
MGSEEFSLFGPTILSTFLLPKSVISIVPYSANSANSKTLDIRILERLLSDDVDCGKLPLLVIATAGTRITGHIDNIPSLQSLSDTYEMWLHARGSVCPLLALPDPPQTLSLLTQCDSVAISNSTLLPGCTSVSLSLLSELQLPSDLQTLETLLPLWAGIQCQGAEGCVANVRERYEGVMELYREIQSIRNIQIMVRVFVVNFPRNIVLNRNTR